MELKNWEFTLQMLDVPLLSLMSRGYIMFYRCIPILARENNVPCSKHPRDVKFFGQYWNGIRLFCPKFLRPKAGANEWEDPEYQLLVFGSTSSCATLWWRENAWIPKPGIGGSLQCFRFLLCLEARSTSQIGCFPI